MAHIVCLVHHSPFNFWTSLVLEIFGNHVTKLSLWQKLICSSDGWKRGKGLRWLIHTSPYIPTCLLSCKCMVIKLTFRHNEFVREQGHFVSNYTLHYTKGLRAESARAFTGRRNSYSGRGEGFLSRKPNFFTETAVTPEQKVEKLFPRLDINRHAKG